VDTFDPNPWGLYNVDGNVWEWTEDCWNESNSGNPGDGRARTTSACTQRVVRGGSWLSVPQYLRSANRNWWLAASRSDVFASRPLLCTIHQFNDFTMSPRGGRHNCAFWA
jgi:formylglycine-generating enzyme required for sulfatase activity